MMLLYYAVAGASTLQSVVTPSRGQGNEYDSMRVSLDTSSIYGTAHTSLLPR